MTPSLILVVEDNPEMNAYIADVLGTHYRVATAFDGQEGLDKALVLNPDLIVCDAMGPRLNGEALVRALRQHPELKQVPIFMLTDRQDENLRVKLLQTGVQDCLAKPFSPEDLRAGVDSLLAQ